MLVQVWICMTYVVIAVLGKMQVFVDVYSMCLDVCNQQMYVLRDLNTVEKLFQNVSIVAATLLIYC